MITINKENKTIIFQSEELEKGLKIYNCELVKCLYDEKNKSVIQAYFKTDEYIKVWDYIEGDSERSSIYKIFYCNGIMGIEIKTPIYRENYINNINFEYNLKNSVNIIIEKLKECFKYNDDESLKEYFKPIMRINNINDYIDNLRDLEGLQIIEDICNNYENNILLAFNKFDIDYLNSNREQKFKEFYDKLVNGADFENKEIVEIKEVSKTEEIKEVKEIKEIKEFKEVSEIAENEQNKIKIFKEEDFSDNDLHLRKIEMITNSKGFIINEIEDVFKFEIKFKTSNVFDYLKFDFEPSDSEYNDLIMFLEDEKYII